MKEGRETATRYAVVDLIGLQTASTSCQQYRFRGLCPAIEWHILVPAQDLLFCTSLTLGEVVGASPLRCDTLITSPGEGYSWRVWHSHFYSYTTNHREGGLGNIGHII